ncbi:MAG: AFG1/ZapE family ATPase [Spirochaetota bacterium]
MNAIKMNNIKLRNWDTRTNIKSNFCFSCDFTGIVHDPHFEQLGMEPIMPCPKCVVSNCKCGGVPPYYFSENGKIIQCTCRDINLKIQKIKSIYSKSGIDKKYKWKFINNYEVLNRITEQVKSAAYDIIQTFPDVKKGLFLWGNPGTGKTLLSSIILTELVKRHAVESKFVKISRTFFNRLKASFNESSPSYGEADLIEREYAEVDVLVIDDFGVQRDSDWELETLYNLVDARYEALKFTIFTSNNNPFVSFKDKSQGRILSRIKEMCKIIELSGVDYRDKL